MLAFLLGSHRLNTEGPTPEELLIVGVGECEVWPCCQTLQGIGRLHPYFRVPDCRRLHRRTVSRSQPCPYNRAVQLPFSVMLRSVSVGSPHFSTARQDRARAAPVHSYTNPRSRCDTFQFAKFGRTVSRSASLMPNHFPRVAAYWSTEVLGIRRPWPMSSGPLFAISGALP